MRLHSRALPMQKAHNDIEGAVLDVLGMHTELTYTEVISIFNQIQASWIKMAIRAERHPDYPHKRGDEE